MPLRSRSDTTLSLRYYTAQESRTETKVLYSGLGRWFSSGKYTVCGRNTDNLIQHPTSLVESNDEF